MKLSSLSFQLHPWMLHSMTTTQILDFLVHRPAVGLKQRFCSRLKDMHVRFELQSSLTTRGCGLEVVYFCHRLEPSSYKWVNIFFLLYFYRYTMSDIQINRPQHPDVYVHCLTWQHTDWLEKWVYCTAEARHTHQSTPATQLPWRRLTLMDSEPACGHTVPIYVQGVLPYI